MNLKVGDIFKHARVLDSNNQPASCTVSKIVQGVIYYRLDGEIKAKNYFPIEQTSRWIKT